VATAVTLDPTRYWECPSCVAQHVTTRGGVITPMHNCRGHAGMLVPYVQAHPGRLNPERRHLRVVERGDFTNGDRGLRRDADGRIAMAVHTERRDGSHDTHVFAALAVGRQEIR
jgi:hypothetical protein